MREVLQIAHDIRRAAKIVLLDTAVLVDGGEPDSFLYKLRIPSSPTRAADLDERLADRITSRPDHESMPVTPNALLDAADAHFPGRRAARRPLGTAHADEAGQGR